MAMVIKFDSAHGLDKPLYWRLNSFDQLGNREPDGTRIPAIARFRAFVSEDAFRSGKSFLEEMLIEFLPSGPNANMAEEAYAALKDYDPSQDAAQNVDSVAMRLEEVKRDEAAAEARLEGKPLNRGIAQMEFDNARAAREEAERYLARAKDAHKEMTARRVAINKAKDA